MHVLIRWQMEKYAISSGSYVTDECVNKSFMIDHRIEGQFDLLVKSELGNENAYTCQEPGKRDSSSSAELIVLSMRLNYSLLVFFMLEIEHNFDISSYEFELLETLNTKQLKLFKLFKLFSKHNINF